MVSKYSLFSYKYIIMPNLHSQILAIDANNMHENFCMSSKIFNIMILDIYKSIDFVI